MLSTTSLDNCKKTRYDDLLSLLELLCFSLKICFAYCLSGVMRVVLSVSYLLVSYFVVNFLRRIFSVCHSFRSIFQSGQMKGFERCVKVEQQGTWRRQNLHAAIFCDRQPAKWIQINLYERHFEPFGERKVPPGIK